MESPELDPAVSDARGFAMAVLLVAIAVMLTLMTVAMPVWRHQVKREKEEELLFRLKQYAHALSLYQRKLPGAAPASVDDLIKQRFLRKKYLDPITGKEFATLRVGQVSPGMTNPLPGMSSSGPITSARPGVVTPPAGLGNTQGPGGGALPTRQPGSSLGAAGASTGAIRGVVSTSKEQSLRVWKGRRQYDQWEVSIEDITPRFGNQGQPGEGDPRGPGVPGGSGGGGRRPGQSGAGPFGRPGQGLPSGPAPPRP